MNESVKPVDVLTEEELYKVEIKFLKMKRDGDLYRNEFEMFNSLLTSHRTLNSRNAKLVHENDELMAENEKLKAALIRERDDALIWDGITVVNRINKTLEELNHE